MKSGFVFVVFVLCLHSMGQSFPLSRNHRDIHQDPIMEEQARFHAHGLGCMCLGCQETQHAAAQARENQLQQERQSQQNLQRQLEQSQATDTKTSSGVDSVLRKMGVVQWRMKSTGKSSGARIDASFTLVDGRIIDYHKYHKYSSMPSPVQIVSSWLKQNGGVAGVVPVGEAADPTNVVLQQDRTPHPSQYRSENAFVSDWVNWKLSVLTPQESFKIQHSLSGMNGYRKGLIAEARSIWRLRR